MRPVVRGDCPEDENGNECSYTNYQNARGELIKRLGEYCSYCEMRLETSLAVEHVRPKKPKGEKANIPEREFDWNNFLLACSNCNSTKGNTDVVLGEYFWPDRDNTFNALQYSEGGLITPAQHLSRDLEIKAKKTVELTGLDKHPLMNAASDPKASDRRWRNRRETWDIAMESKTDLAACNTPQMRRQILRSVHGYWSIWMTVFQDEPDMLKEFIEAFPGTCLECFDEQNNYQPVIRVEGQI